MNDTPNITSCKSNNDPTAKIEPWGEDFNRICRDALIAWNETVRRCYRATPDRRERGRLQRCLNRIQRGGLPTRKQMALIDAIERRFA